MKEHLEHKELNRIEKRAIEALAVAPVIRAVSQRIGKEEALAILQGVNQQEAFQRGQNMMEKEEQNGIAELVNEVVLGRGGSMGNGRDRTHSNDLFFQRDPVSLL